MTGKEIAEKLGIEHTHLLEYPFADLLYLNADEDYDVSNLHPKVKIPKFVADYIERCKTDSVGIGNAMLSDSTTDDIPSEVSNWLYDASLKTVTEHQEKFARAWLDGYEIEEEQKYLLPMEGTEDLVGDVMYAFVDNKSWTSQFLDYEPDNITSPIFYVTQSQIDSAPAWVKAIKPVKINE